MKPVLKFLFSIWLVAFIFMLTVARAHANQPVATGNNITNPAAATPQITTTTATGNITSCQGTASADPNIEEFTVSGSNLLGGVIVTAPANFEISLNATAGYTNAFTLPESGGTLSNTTIYVRSAATDPAGNIYGNVVLSSSGAVSNDVSVTGIINIVPSVSAQPTTQEVTAGTSTTPINFTGVGDVFTWTNDTPSIGLAASSSGNIPSFTATNTGTNEVTATITVVPQQVAYAYIANQQSNTVSVINTITNSVVSTIPVGQAPTGAAASPDGTRVYITNQGDNSISVINTLTNKVISVLKMQYITTPTGIAVSPDGRTVYAVNQRTSTVISFDAATGNTIFVYTVSGQPVGIVASPDNTKVFVTNSSNAISVIDVINNAVSAIPAGKASFGICISSDGSLLYVANSASNTVSVINVSTSAIIANIPVGTTPVGIAISPDGSTLYVANAISGNVSVISTATNKVITTITTGSAPIGVSITNDGRFVYVTNQNSNSVSVINAANNTILTTIPVGRSPESLGNFIIPGSTCPGNPVSFTIKVKPVGTAGIYSADAVSGYITACQGTASVNPDIESFHVTGSSLANNVTATAPTGFEVSLDPNTGYGNSVTIMQSGGNINKVPVYVRSAITAPAGNLSGNVILSSPGGADYNVPVNGTINVVPTVSSQTTSQEVVTGTTTGAINFTGTGDIVTWTNDTPSIGLAASGSGDIAAFTAVNNTNNKITATITATPQRVGYAYIANQGDNTVSVINTVTNKVIATPEVNVTPTGVAISPDGSNIFVTNSGNSVISFISPYTNVQSLAVGLILYQSSPIGIAVNPDGSKMYVAESAAGEVAILSTSKGVDIDLPYAVGGNPIGVTISPDGTKLFVTNSTASMKVVNTLTADINTINVPIGTYESCISPGGNLLYVTVPGKNAVSVVNVSTNIVIATIPVGQKPEGINISPDGSTVYVADNSSANVSVINTATNIVTKTIQVGTSPLGVCVTGDGGSVYVTNQGSNSVSVINTATNSVSTTIPVGRSPASLGNFILSGSGCPGRPSTFTITVDPKVLPVITASTVTGSIEACEGSPSADPYIGQITVSGTNLTSAVTAAAQAGFEVSINPTTGYNINATIPESGGTLNNTVVYVRSAASAQVGNVSGNITLSSSGISQTVPVSGIIDALPTANKIANQTVANGNTTAAINFTGTTSVFDWTNNTPSIGLPASGAGNIAPFTAINSSNIPVTAKVTVTPVPSVSGYAYIANSLSNNVSVIDLQTTKVTKTIPVGNTPDGVYVSPAGDRVYVTNLNDGTVSVINTVTNSVDKVVTVGGSPYGVTVSPDGQYVYATNEASLSVSVINTSNYTVVSIPIGGVPTSAVVSPDGSHLYVTGFNQNLIYVINTSSNTIEKTIPVVNQPFNLAVSPDGSSLYDLSESALYVINTSTYATTATIAVGANAVGIAVSPDGKTIYVSNDGANTVSVIDAATNLTTNTVNIGHGPGGISVSPDGSLVYVTNETDGTVSVIDTKSNTVINTVTVGGGPVSLGKFITGNAMKCEGVSVTFTITVEPSSSGITTQNNLIIPNTFTPNGDGINDTWEIKALQNYPNCTVAIYSRWGEKLYSSIGYPIPWDGTYKGASLPVGTYYYIIDLKNGVGAYSGWVAIVK